MNNSIINPVYASFNTSITANFVTFCANVEQIKILPSFLNPRLNFLNLVSRQFRILEFCILRQPYQFHLTYRAVSLLGYIQDNPVSVLFLFSLS